MLSRENLHSKRLAFLTDRPYRLTLDTAEVRPQFGFDTLADSIAKVILETPPNLTLAVYGEWGSGKTTLLQAVVERLESRACVIAWFDMWQYRHESDVVPFVITAIADAIADDLPPGHNAPARLRDLARAALISTKIGGGIGGAKIEFGAGSFVGELDRLWSRPRLARESLSKPIADWQRAVEEVGTTASASQPRVVVVVDNLDRCLPEQAVPLLEQTTSLFDFEGVVFVIAAQKDWIANAVEGVYKLAEGAGESYLEKVVQVEFVVPGIDKGRVVEWIHSLVDDSLAVSDEEARLLAETCEWNPRRIKRVLNNIRIVPCASRQEFASEKGLALASTLLLYRDPSAWRAITGDTERRAQVRDQIVRPPDSAQ